MKILDGKKTSATILEQLKIEVAQRSSEGKSIPHLVAILVGTNGASETYVAAKVKACEEVGFQSTLIRYESTISENELLNKIRELNSEPEVDGILVQLPLPAHIRAENVVSTIDPGKDVDGFNPESIGRMIVGLPAFVSATPYGIMLLLEYNKIETKGKHAVVIGRSNIVGRPVSVLLSNNTNPGNCTVTLCHSKTANVKEICLQADIIIAAIGRPGYVTADMVKEGATVIDVGITRVPDPARKSGFRLKGDVDFDAVSKKAEWITPVPGGVGPMTIAALMKNTMKANIQRNYE